MIDNDNILEQTPVEEDSNQHYIDAIQELQRNSVSKERYNKLVEENKNLLQSLVDGGSVTTVTEAVEEKKSLNELRNELFRPKKELTNLEFIEKSLELRDRVLEETGEDCFVSAGHHVTPTAESYANAQRVADIYRECIEYANGNSEIFTQELMRRTVDNPVANINNRKR